MPQQDAWPVPPDGTIVSVQAGANESQQETVTIWGDPRLCAPHYAGDPRFGSLVYDTTKQGGYNGDRQARLQTLVRVIRKPNGQANALAHVLGKTGLGDNSGGWFADKPDGGGDDEVAFGHGSYTQMGPFHVGSKNDRHNLGKDHDKNSLAGLHLWTEANFYRDKAKDGPIMFEDTYFDGDDHIMETRCHIAWDGGAQRWRIYTTDRIFPSLTTVPVDSDLTPVDKTTVGGGGTPTGGGGGGGGGEGGGQVMAPINTETSAADVGQGHNSSMNDLSTPSVLAKPDPARDGKKALANWDPGMSISQLASLGGTIAQNAAAAIAQHTSTPITGQMTSWGAEGGPLKGTYPNAETGASGDPWVYTAKPNKARFAEGTANGGWVILPPEVKAADQRNGYAPDGITKSTTFFMVGPGAWFGAGIPEISDGSGVQDGWTWGMDTANGDLLFRKHSGGVLTDGRVKFDVSGENIAWSSNTAFYGTLDHAITAARTWTFPDAGGDVPIETGTGTPGGGAAATLGNIGGGTNPTAAAQSHWVQVNIAGTTYYLAAWQ